MKPNQELNLEKKSDSFLDASHWVWESSSDTYEEDESASNNADMKWIRYHAISFHCLCL
jgi:hypothetical protein